MLICVRKLCGIDDMCQKLNIPLVHAMQWSRTYSCRKYFLREMDCLLICFFLNARVDDISVRYVMVQSIDVQESDLPPGSHGNFVVFSKLDLYDKTTYT